MSSPTTVARSNYLPSAALGNATSETQFTGSNGSVLSVYVPASAKLSAPGGASMACFAFKAGGRVTGGTTTNFTPAVYWGTSTTIGSNTKIAGPSAAAVNSVSSQWHVEGVLLWDVTSKTIHGFFASQINATTGTPATLSNAPTSIDLSAADTTSLGLTVTGLFGSTNANNTAYVDYFEVEVY